MNGKKGLLTGLSTNVLMLGLVSLLTDVSSEMVLPILPLFKEVLGADSLMLGFSVPDCNLHSPNEFFHVADFVAGTRCILRFIERLGHM